MRFWLAFAFAHVMLVVSILWNVQHVTKVNAYGWFAAMGLNGASTRHIVMTFAVLAVVYVLQLTLLVKLIRAWRDVLRGFTSD